jgi:hypothetical protein
VADLSQLVDRCARGVASNQEGEELRVAVAALEAELAAARERLNIEARASHKHWCSIPLGQKEQTPFEECLSPTCRANFAALSGDSSGG